MQKACIIMEFTSPCEENMEIWHHKKNWKVRATKYLNKI